MSRNDERNYVQIAYEFPEIWEPDWFSDADRDRVRHIADLIPDSATTLADIGCGNGLLLNFLQSDPARTFERLCGVDRSEAALAHVATEKHLAPVDALPLNDREFDVVTCLEVLEHLSVNTFPAALDELSRVARQFIVVSVPYRQDMEASLASCPCCCTRFNPDFHVRSFDESKLSTLFAAHGFRQRQVLCLLESLEYPDQILRRRLKTRLFGHHPLRFPSYAMCPVCGFHEPLKLREELAGNKERQVRTQPHVDSPQPKNGILRALLSTFMTPRKHYRWICVLYERQV